MGVGDGRFEGKVAAVTGAAGGIGRATVARFVDEGARVLAVDLEERALDETYGNRGDTIATVAADVAREDDTRRYLDEAVARFGGLDYLFNGAGIIGAVSPIADYPTETYEKVMAVNVTGVFLAMKHAVPILRTRGGGAIVNAASVAGLQGSAAIPAYSASKHAVIGLTRSVAAAHAGEGIRVNAICPAPIDTGMIEELQRGLSAENPDAARAVMQQRIPVGRYGQPAEIAALIAFLCSDEAAFINGSLYTIDGGMTPF